MADSSPLEADPKDVTLATVAMAAVGVFAMFLDGGFEIGLVILGLAGLMAIIAIVQWKRAP